MSIQALAEVVHSLNQDRWSERNKGAFATLFGNPGGRYLKQAYLKAAKLRAPEMTGDSGVPFAAYIHPQNPDSGPYSGLSFVMFPVTERPCLIGMVVGTQGLSPDEAILGRPGHARKTQAICSWLNRKYGNGNFVAWAKQDPTRTDLSVPQNITKQWPEYKNVFDRYGKEIYALYSPTADHSGTEAALAAFLDLLLEERGYQTMTGAQANSQAIRLAWFDHLMPSTDNQQVKELLNEKRYVIVQGPPGTGKTRMATQLLNGDYGGRGRTIQFHPNTTYENFIGGLAPTSSSDALGLRFSPLPGFLMGAAAEALEDPGHNYLLHIDEINRADLGKVLGEAIFLLEAGAQDRKIELPYDFGEPFRRTFFLPRNLHILGTMNSADRSIAILDVAVRRRFAFVSLWPRMSVVEDLKCEVMTKAFRDLISIFIEHAANDAFSLVPGHSYFLEESDDLAKRSLRVNLAPLLEEYLAQGYVGGFAEPIRGYLQELRSL